MDNNIIFENDYSIILLEEGRNGQKQIRKINRTEDLISEKKLRFRNEFACTFESNVSGIRKALELEEHKGMPSLVLEYIDGETLVESFIKKSKSIEQMIDVFADVTHCLLEIHQSGIIHRDINPRNILIRHSDHRAIIIDFEKASKFDSHVNMFISFENGKNNLAYVAPEQTGRVNRRVDARSDLYSLGITFFELFTGKLPYHSNDPLELLHFHLAKEIPNATMINSQVPEMISRILIKLMAKDAEDRYQTAQGLLTDLLKCQSEFSKSRKISIFELGLDDNSGKLIIPQQLYGRYEEIKALLRSFDRVCKGSTEMLMVSGYSGIGKTSLIGEMYKPATAKRAFFISGKFEQYQRNTPYYAVNVALSEFCNRLLTESKEKLDLWKENLLKSLNNQGKVLIDMIPSLEKIIGPQPEVEKLENQESQIRQRLVFQNFIKCICGPEHPLVLFVDDLQWADVESLSLISSLLTEARIPYLMLVGAYRDNEVSAGHPLLSMIEQVSIENASIQKILLKPLQEEHVFQLISETLLTNDVSVQNLAEIVFQKTQGNAFFIIEFLKSLHQSGDIKFDPTHKNWDIQIDAIKAKKITSNVVELLIANLSRMEKKTQDILSKAACIGSKFDLTLLSKIKHEEISSLIKGLYAPLRDNYIIPISPGFEFVEQSELNSEAKLEFSFSHDRIQQACYSLLKDEEKPLAHLEIAKHLEQFEKQEDALFDIVHHYNSASVLITKEDEKLALLKRNLLAAQYANESGSFNSAQIYIDHAQSLSSEKVWKIDYQAAYDLNKIHAELDYLNGRFEASEKRLQYCLENSIKPIDKSRLYFALTQNYANQARYQDAIATIRQGLKQLNFIFPTSDEAAALIPQEMGAILTYFQEHGVDSLKSLPFIEDEEKKATMLLLDNLSPNTYVTGEVNLWTLHVLYKINFTIQNGWTYEGFYAFTELSIILNILNMFDYGAQSTELGFFMAEKYRKGSMRHYGRAAHIHLHYGSTFIKNIKDIIKDTPKFYQICLENGEMVFAGYLSMYSILDNYYWGRDALSKITQRIPDTLEFLGRIKHMLAYGSIQAFDLVSAFLENKTSDQNPFDTERLTQQSFLSTHGANNLYAVTMMNLKQADAFLLTGNLHAAHEAILKVEPLNAILLGMALQDSMYRLLSGIIHMDMIREDQAQMEAYLPKVQAIRDQFALWHPVNPSTFGHKFHLLEAEWHSLNSNFKEALDHYKLAIEAANSNEYNKDLGLIHLRLAGHWIREGQSNYAIYHYEKSVQIFSTLDYVRVVKYVDTALKMISPSQGVLQKNPSKSKSGFTENTAYEMMDVQSILKASNILSEEIEYDILIEKLLKIVNENIGGQRALLLTMQDDLWYVTADYDINQQNPLNIINKPISKFNDLPNSVIHFMVRSPQIINNSSEAFHKLFEPDSYWKTKKYINFVALPLQHKGTLIGILYIENTVDGGSFTNQRLETISMLSSQMAVSLENANLYRQQRDLNKAYQKFVPHSFLETLGHKDILKVSLGDCIDEEMTVMFCDIRSYSTMAEGMSAEENFKFINSFLQSMLPAITEYQGYVNHFLGDGFIALFKSNPEAAIEASIKMHQYLQILNKQRLIENKLPIEFGIGLHTGKVMLGVIGDDTRYDANVLSDAVNLASRLETMTKVFSTSGIVSGDTYEIVKTNPYFKFRYLGKVKVKGRKLGLDIYEILSIVDSKIAELKIQHLENYNTGIDNFYNKNFTEAALNLKKVLDANSHDAAARKYLQLSAKYMVEGVDPNWTGEEEITV